MNHGAGCVCNSPFITKKGGTTLRKYFGILAMVLFLATFSVSAFALEIPELKGRVNDYANMFKAQEVVAMETRLEKHEQETSNQIVVLTIPSLQGQVLEEFSIKVAEKWKIGQKGKDNGVIIIIAKDDKKIRIEVGRGLEGVLTDLLSGRIIQDMIPHFKNGNAYQGITVGIDNVIKAIAGEYKGDGKTGKKTDYTSEIAIGALFIVAVIAGFVHLVFGGVVGAVGAPFIAVGLLHMGAWAILPAILVGFIIGLIARFIITDIAPIVLAVGFGGGGGDFGGGGASGGW